jgi:hypothetical protein
MIGLGYYLKRTNILTSEHFGGLSKLLLSVILPFSVLVSGNQHYSNGLAQSLVFTVGIVGAYYILALFLSWILFRFIIKEKGKVGVSITMTVFANTGFMGFPLAMILYGPEGLLYAAVYNLLYNLFLFSFGVKLLGADTHSISWKEIVSDPLTISSILAIILFISPIKLPPFLQSTLEAVGDMTGPISMMIVGAWMVGVNWKRILLSKFAYVVCCIRLLVYPLITLLILTCFNLRPEMLGTIVLLTALPIGSLNVIFAEKYGADVVYVNETMLLSLFFSMITIPIVMMLV